jgi:hypothetical protein
MFFDVIDWLSINQFCRSRNDRGLRFALARPPL